MEDQNYCRVLQAKLSAALRGELRIAFKNVDACPSSSLHSSRMRIFCFQCRFSIIGSIRMPVGSGISSFLSPEGSYFTISLIKSTSSFSISDRWWELAHLVSRLLFLSSCCCYLSVFVSSTPRALKIFVIGGYTNSTPSFL